MTSPTIASDWVEACEGLFVERFLHRLVRALVALGFLQGPRPGPLTVVHDQVRPWAFPSRRPRYRVTITLEALDEQTGRPL